MDLDQILRFALALVFVLGLIGAFALLGRRMGFAPRVTAPMLGRARRRLGIVEILSIDAKRKLILVRRDDREHLLLLGATQDLVVEGNLAAPAATADEPAVPAEPAPRRGLLTRLTVPSVPAGRPE